MQINNVGRITTQTFYNRIEGTNSLYPIEIRNCLEGHPKPGPLWRPPACYTIQTEFRGVTYHHVYVWLDTQSNLII